MSMLTSFLRKLSGFTSRIFSKKYTTLQLSTSNGTSNAGKLFSTEKKWQDLQISRLAKAELNTLQSLVPLNKLCNYVALFEGNDKGEKATAAALIAKEERRQLFRIDVSQVVSKFMGDTEKKLNELFVVAQQSDWILFFDEADALFGKRSAVKESHDKFANQAINYLLQKIEDYKGVVFVATTFIPSEDNYIKKKCQAVITFDEEGAED